MLKEEINRYNQTPKNKQESRKKVRDIIQRILPDMSETITSLHEEGNQTIDGSFLLKNLEKMDKALQDNPGSGKHRPPRTLTLLPKSKKEKKNQGISKEEEIKMTKFKALCILQEGCYLRPESEGIFDLIIGKEEQKYRVDMTGHPTCTCPLFSGQKKVKKVCKHICVSLLMIGVKNTENEGNILTKSCYSKRERKKIDTYIDQLKKDQFIRECDKVLEDFQPTIQDNKKEEVITELPFINVKEVISKHDSYAEAMKEISTNEFSPKWFGIISNNGRHQCPGSAHTQRFQVSKGSLAVICDFFSVRKSLHQFIVRKERRYFCCQPTCVSSYGPISLNRFSNLKPPDSINIKYLDQKQANSLIRMLPDVKTI